MDSIFCDVEGMLLVDYLDKDHIVTIIGAYYADLPRQLWEKQADLAWKADKMSAVSLGQGCGTHIHSGHGCYPEMWIPTCQRPTLFSWFGSLWLLPRDDDGPLSEGPK